MKTRHKELHFKNSYPYDELLFKSNQINRHNTRNSMIKRSNRSERIENSLSKKVSHKF